MLLYKKNKSHVHISQKLQHFPPLAHELKSVVQVVGRKKNMLDFVFVSAWCTDTSLVTSVCEMCKNKLVLT